MCIYSLEAGAEGKLAAGVQFIYTPDSSPKVKDNYGFISPPRQVYASPLTCIPSFIVKWLSY